MYILWTALREGSACGTRWQTIHAATVSRDRGADIIPWRTRRPDSCHTTVDPRGTDSKSSSTRSPSNCVEYSVWRNELDRAGGVSPICLPYTADAPAGLYPSS